MSQQTMIHKTAIISENAIIGQNVKIGPYCVIGPNVVLEQCVELFSHVCIDGHTRIGEKTQIYPFASIGYAPQDLKYNGEKSLLIIGANNIIRENVTIHPGTHKGSVQTTIGNDCLFMVGSHIAHDCIVGNNVIMANNATLGGHVTVGDNAIIGGLAAVHQFVRIGRNAIIGGVSAVVQDVIPFGSAAGDRAKLIGINIIGMQRHNHTKEEIHAVRKAYQKIFLEKNHTFHDRVESLAKEKEDGVLAIVNFLRNSSSRSICLPN